MIGSYEPYLRSEVMPLLGKSEGDKTLLFKCKRLLENKVIEESNSLFLNTVLMFLTDREDELFALDYEKMIKGKINYGLGMRFWLK